MGLFFLQVHYCFFLLVIRQHEVIQLLEKTAYWPSASLRNFPPSLDRGHTVSEWRAREHCPSHPEQQLSLLQHLPLNDALFNSQHQARQIHPILQTRNEAERNVGGDLQSSDFYCHGGERRLLTGNLCYFLYNEDSKAPLP